MNRTHLIDERELLVKLRDGDHSAYDLLYNNYSEKLTAKLFKLLKSWDEVEDALQELFVKVWENREKIDPDKSFPSYLYRIAVNIVNDYYQQVSKDRVLAQNLSEHISYLYSIDTLTSQVTADEELMRTIEKLPPQRKIIFKLCKLEGKTYAEVSKMLSISEATIGDHITKANRFIYGNYDKSALILSLLYSVSVLDQ